VAEDLKHFVVGEWTEGTGEAVDELIRPVTGEQTVDIDLRNFT
jgi:hypothetical protein